MRTLPDEHVALPRAQDVEVLDVALDVRALFFGVLGGAMIDRTFCTG